MTKNLKISPKEDFPQKRPILLSASPEFVLRFENILFGSKSEVHESNNFWKNKVFLTENAKIVILCRFTGNPF